MGSEVVGVADYRGAFQTHSTWSDGGESIASMVTGCRALGHACLGVTDHSHGLAIARGISMADAAEQGREIDALNARYDGAFRTYKGIEANILADGSLDSIRWQTYLRMQRTAAHEVRRVSRDAHLGCKRARWRYRSLTRSARRTSKSHGTSTPMAPIRTTSSTT